MRWGEGWDEDDPRKISLRNKEYKEIQIINFNIKEKKEFHLAQLKRWAILWSVEWQVGSSAGASSNSMIRAGRMLFRKTRTAVTCSAGLIEGEWPWALCWVPETGRSPIIRPRNSHPAKGRGGALGLSLLTRRPLRTRCYEGWRVALRGREGRRRFDDWGARVRGHTQNCWEQFWVRPLREDPSLCSEVGRRGL